MAKTTKIETRFRAIVRASVHGKTRILPPMVSSVQEVRRARDVLNRAVAKLKRKGGKIPGDPPPLGVMIDVPEAALSADALARVSDLWWLPPFRG